MELSDDFMKALDYANKEGGDRLTRFEEALVFTARLHASQRRKGTGLSYLGHLLGVASLVNDNGGSEDEIIAGLLHDGPEDRGGEPTRKVVEKHFGPNVASIVAACTDAEVMPKPPWQKRKEAYIAHLRDAKTSPSARLVSCADKLHNARALVSDYRQIGEKLWERFNKDAQSAAKQLWYYSELAKAFKDTTTTPALVEELERTVNELKKLVAEKESAAVPARA